MIIIPFLQRVKIQAVTYAQVRAQPIPGGKITKTFVPIHFPREDRFDEAYPAESNRNAVHKEFSHEESTLLLRGTEGSGRISRLHARLTVLQGATFSAFALMVLSGFAWCGRSAKNTNAIGGSSPRQMIRKSVGFLLSLGLITVAADKLLGGIHRIDAGDMPVAEILFLALGGFGLWVTISGTQSRAQFHGLAFVVAFCFALLCYGGYASTEISYAEEIFNDYQALPPANVADTAHNAAADTTFMAPVRE